ncbi:hypothetical protein GC176_13880 [bacterium]|nr:hypothetical protein [bacterium]
MPTLGVGTASRTLRVLTAVDAERPFQRSRAERGNELTRQSDVKRGTGILPVICIRQAGCLSHGRSVSKLNVPPCLTHSTTTISIFRCRTVRPVCRVSVWRSQVRWRQ